MTANDDGSTGRITLPFSINFFGTTYNSLYINNNGNLTFNSPLSRYTPFTIDARTPPIIAPFFADVDTRGSASGKVQYSYSAIDFEGHAAFCVNWINVGYYNYHTDKLNGFQVLLVDRSDTGTNNFDIVMNYDRIVWETGDASGGRGGMGGTSAGAGFSAGNGAAGSFFQFQGSLVNGALLDTNATTGLARTSHNSTLTGRHVFSIRSGQPVVNEHIALAPLSASGRVGSSHTVTATLQNDLGQPLPNRTVTFHVTAGPNTGVSGTAASNGAGQAGFTYLGVGGLGTDQLVASFVKSSGQVGTSNIARQEWTGRPPIAVCRNLVLEAGLVCGVAGSIDNGSSDPDGDLVGCTQSPAGPFGLGTTNVTLTCVDSLGLSSSCTGIVQVVDHLAPAIICPAGAQAECVGGSATVNTGVASATDNCGPVTVNSPAPASYPLGTSVVVHSASDVSGNTSSCTSTVVVQDTLAPSIAVNGSASAQHECGSPYVDPGAVASDLCAGDLSGDILTTGAVDTGTPGSYSIQYSVADAFGHSAGASRSVIVQDTLVPQIAVVAGPSVIECSTPYVDPGATADDVCAGDLTANITVSSTVDTSAPGQYAVTYAVTDGAGNAASAVRPITVADSVAPAIQTTLVTMWPPNHKMQSFTLADCAAISDSCDTSLDINTAGRITSIYSDEPEDERGAGDGATLQDIVITSRSSFALRLEREGGGNGRVYEVSFTVQDASGNVTNGTCFFSVPHDQSDPLAIDDGAAAGYTVVAPSASARQ